MANKYSLIGLLSALILLSTVVVADTKLGYVDAAKLLVESPQSKKASKGLAEEFGARQSDLIAAKAALEAMQKQLNRDGLIMSDSARKKLRLDILSQQRNFMRDDEALRHDATIRQSEVLGKLQELIRKAIVVVGENEDYDIILFEGIAYAKPGLDITGQVLKELERIYSSTNK